MRALIAPGFVASNFTRLLVTDVPMPQLKSSTEVLVKIAYSSVNPIDWKILAPPGYIPLKFPAKLGFDMAGTVVAVGADCHGFQPGDAVWTDLADDGLGGYAEYAVVQCSHLGHAPKSMSLLEAATLPLVAMTGRAALFAAGAPWHHRAEAAVAGPVVMVLGGSGGCGAAGIQLAKAWGASNVYTTTSRTNFRFVQSIGADRAFDYHTQDWVTELGPDSVDIVYDTVGVKGSANAAMPALRSGGVWVTIVFELATKPKPGVRQVAIKNWEKNATALDDIAAVVMRGALRGTVSATVGLAAVPSAFGVSAEGHVLGKIAVDVGKRS